MPCFVTGSEIGDRKLFAQEDREALRASNRKLLEVTRLLCSACQELKLRGLIGVTSYELQTWWKAHEKKDKKRAKRGKS